MIKFNLPDQTGHAGEVLNTDGVQPFWGAAGVVGSGAAPSIAYWNALGQLTGDANLVWDASTQEFNIYSGGNGKLTINPTTGLYAIGNWSGGGVGAAFIAMESGPARGVFGQYGSSTRFGYLAATSTYFLGDISTFNKGTTYIVSDSDRRAYSRGLVQTAGGIGFTGVGLNDLSYTTDYSQKTTHTYVVTISLAGATDEFDFTIDGGTVGTGVPITGGPQSLTLGVNITFGATTGHTLGESWTFIVYQNAAPGLDLDFKNRIYTFGDNTAVSAPNAEMSNFTKIVVDDAAQTIKGYTRVGFVAIPLFQVGSSNTSFGSQAMENNPSGGGNSAFGSGAGQSLSTGFLNMFMGELAGNSTQTGNNNVAIGAGALRYNVGGDGNIGIGYRAAEQVDGDNNVMIGNGTGYQVQVGDNNLFLGATTANYWVTTTGQIAIGHGSFLGDSAVPANNTGVNNLILGVNTGNTISSGSRNTLLGTTADVATAGTNDAIAIGYGAVAKTNQVAFPAAITSFKASLAAFDDDADAGVGGLVTGEWYQTTGLGAAPLNVAGIVMIKQ